MNKKLYTQPIKTFKRERMERIHIYILRKAWENYSAQFKIVKPFV